MASKLILKAVMPVAGLGTRLRPLSAVVPKAMMPVPDSRGRILPVLHHVLAEVAAAGVAEAAVIASPPHADMLRAYLRAAGETPGGRKGELPPRVKIIVQDKPLGFGHAVLLAKRFVGANRFLVMLGDHIQESYAGEPACAAQVAWAFAAYGGAAMIGVQPVDAAELPRVGVARGAPIGDGGASGRRGRGDGKISRRGKIVLRCADFVEKPDPRTAFARLRTPGLPRGRFLAHCGIYAFTPEIFDCLEESLARRKAGEVQLADAQTLLLSRHRDDYHLIRIAGRAYDTGTPAGYLATWKSLLKNRRGR
jgi:UTP--glucose-1-phosphate uridylyltransferase